MAEAPQWAQGLEADIGHAGPPEGEGPEPREGGDEWDGLVPEGRRPQVEQLETAEMAEGSQDGLGGGAAHKDQGLQVQRAEALQGRWIRPGLQGPELDLGAGRHPYVTPGLAELPPPGVPSMAGPAGNPLATGAAHGQHPEGLLHGEIKLPAWERQSPKG